MAVFNFGKKKEEKKVEEIKNECCPDLKKGEICCIKVLGAGCKSCHEQYENVKQAVKDMGLSVEVEYITDMQKVMEYGVMSMPALVVNEKVVAMGKVLKTADIVVLLHKGGSNYGKEENSLYLCSQFLSKSDCGGARQTHRCRCV